MKKLILCMAVLFFVVSPVVQASESGEWEFTVESWAAGIGGYPSLFEEYTFNLSDEPVYYLTSASSVFGMDGEMEYSQIQTMGDSSSIPVYNISNGVWSMSFWKMSSGYSIDDIFKNSVAGEFSGLILPGNPSYVLVPYPNKNSESRMGGVQYSLFEGLEIQSVDVGYTVGHFEFGVRYLNISNDFGYKTSTSGCWYGVKIMSGKNVLESMSRVEFQGAGPYIAFKGQFKNKKWKVSYDVGTGVVLGSSDGNGVWSSKASRTISWISFNSISSNSYFYEKGSSFDEPEDVAVIVVDLVAKLSYKMTSHITINAGIKVESMTNMPLAPVFTIPTEYEEPGAWSKRSEDVVLAGATLGITYTW